ncbi:hypothetical protein ABEF95_005079 [Exophiala dermatitidis]
MYDAAAIAFCTVSLTILATITLVTFWWRKYRRQHQVQDQYQHQHQHQKQQQQIEAHARAPRGPLICPNDRVLENSSNSKSKPKPSEYPHARDTEYIFDCKYNRGWSGSRSVEKFAEELEQDDAMTDFAEARDSGGYVVEVVPDNNSPSPLNANERKNVVSAAASSSSSSQNNAEWEEQIRIVELEATVGTLCSAEDVHHESRQNTKCSLSDGQYIAALLEGVLSSQQLSPIELQHMSLVPAPLNIRRERDPGWNRSSHWQMEAPTISRGVDDQDRTSRHSLYQQPHPHPHPLRSHPVSDITISKPWLQYGEADEKATTDTLQCPRPAHHRIQADEDISQQPIPGNRYNDSIIGRYLTGKHGSGCATESERWTMASEATLWV